MQVAVIIILSCLVAFLIYKLYHFDNTLYVLTNKLISPNIRGSFGEEILEECLDKIGLVQNVHYVLQATDHEGNTPDVTLLLPNGLKCNIDSKFPYNNLQKGEISKFLKDCRQRIRELAVKSYIDPSAGTTNFAICFIPNDSIYSIILDKDPTIHQYTRELNVILATPYTLFAILYAIKHFYTILELTDENLQVIKNRGEFHKQLDKMKEDMNKLEGAFDKLHVAFNNVNNTRIKALEKAVNRV